MKEFSIPKYFYTASNYLGQDDNDPGDHRGFKFPEAIRGAHHRALKPRDLVCWTLALRRDFDDVHGTLSMLPYPGATDAV